MLLLCCVCVSPSPLTSSLHPPPPTRPGREPSISSDTRTDSSTESYSYRQPSHSHHESLASRYSSDSQGTVICIDRPDGAPHASLCSLDTVGGSERGTGDTGTLFSVCQHVSPPAVLSSKMEGVGVFLAEMPTSTASFLNCVQFEALVFKKELVFLW